MTQQKKTIFAFDLHGVVFTRDYKKMCTILWKTPHKFKLFLALCNPLFWFKTIKLMYNKGVAEQFIVELPQKHKRLIPFIPLGITIANTQKPIQSVVDLLNELKAKGYQLHIFSNIGALTFENLRPQYPEIFALFNSITVPSQENGYIRKPTKEAFYNFFKNSSSTTADHRIIFIDDSRSNINAAPHYGIHGIYFKSPTQLRNELKNLCI